MANEPSNKDRNDQNYHMDEILKREPTPDEARKVKADQEKRASNSEQPEEKISSDNRTEESVP